jgi:meiotically up-regulated gene 157 (Mug157) protein
MLDGYTNAFKRFEDKKQKRPFYLNDVSETLIMGMQVDLCRRKEFATPSIWERKFEIDSLASFLRLSYEHYLAFDSIKFVNLKWIKAIRRLLSVLDEEINDATYEK